MDVDKSDNYGDWRDNVVVFKLPNLPHKETDKRKIRIREYLMKEAEVTPVFYANPMGKRDIVIASFIDSADSKKCQGKIECVDDIIYKRVMKSFNFEFWDLKFKSKWVSMNGLKENTTRQQIIDYIKKNGNIKVKEKDIYLGRSRYDFFAKIECRSNSDAQKLVQTLNLSELNGSKVVIEMELPPEGKSTVLHLWHLDEDVTEQDIAYHIEKHGKIETPPTSIELRSTKHQKGAQITFASNEDLVQTVRNLNCTELKGKEVSVSWIIRDNYGDWRDNVAVFKLPKVPNTSKHQRMIQIREYLMNKAEVQPLLCWREKDGVMAVFIDSADSKKCKEKIECVDDTIYKSGAKKLRSKYRDQRLKSKWVSMYGLKKNTTKQQVIEYIKKNGISEVKKKDIFIGRSDDGLFAKIECRSNSDAQKSVQTQKLSELNGSKVVIEMALPPEGKSTILLLSNLDEDVTEQDIADHIKEHGKIETPPTSIELSSFKNQKKSQITFASNQDLVQTMRNLNCTELKGKEVFMTWTPKKKKVGTRRKGRKIKVVRKETVSERSSKGKIGKTKNQGRIKMKKETEMGWKMKAFKNKKVSKMHSKVKKKEKKKGKKGGVKKSVKV